MLAVAILCLYVIFNTQFPPDWGNAEGLNSISSRYQSLHHTYRPSRESMFHKGSRDLRCLWFILFAAGEVTRTVDYSYVPSDRLRTDEESR